MGCPNTIVPGLEESDKVVKATPLAMKMEQLLSDKYSRKHDWRMDEEKTPLFDHLANKKIYPKERRKNVNRMTRKQLVEHLDAMELPETDARDFDNDTIKEILLHQASDMYMSSS